MTLTEDQRTALDAPLDGSRIKERSQGGRTLSYLEGYDIIDTANCIFGFEGWGYEVLSIEVVSQGTFTSDNREKPWAIYEAIVKVWLTDEPVSWRTDVGHGIARPSDSPETVEMQRKGAVTDAMKRAFRTFGAQFGNTLYDKAEAQERQRRTRYRAARQAAPQRPPPPAPREIADPRPPEQQTPQGDGHWSKVAAEAAQLGFTERQALDALGFQTGQDFHRQRKTEAGCIRQLKAVIDAAVAGNTSIAVQVQRIMAQRGPKTPPDEP